MAGSVPKWLPLFIIGGHNMKFIPFLNNLMRVSFRCYFPDGSSTTHYQVVLANEIVKWIDCYMFTHPDCISISVKLWFDYLEDADED